MLEHSFERLVWLVSILETHRELIDKEELFYERAANVTVCARLKIDMPTEEEAKQLIECTGSTDDEGDSEPGKRSSIIFSLALLVFNTFKYKHSLVFFFNFSQPVDVLTLPVTDNRKSNV